MNGQPDFSAFGGRRETNIPDFALWVEVAGRAEVDEVARSAEVDQSALVGRRSLLHTRDDQFDQVAIERGRRVDDDVVLLAQRPNEFGVGECPMDDAVYGRGGFEIVIRFLIAEECCQGPVRVGFLEIGC